MERIWNNRTLSNGDPEPTAIETINNNDIVVDSYYTLDGQQIVAPRKGVNIVRMSDGTVKKVIVK